MELGSEELTRTREELDTMNIRRDRLVVRGDTVVRGVTEVIELFRDIETELMNQLVDGVVDVAKHTAPNRGKSGWKISELLL